MENTCCGRCIHFRLHYIKYARGKYSPLSYGLCVKTRRKKRYASDKACAHWQERTASAQLAGEGCRISPCPYGQACRRLAYHRSFDPDKPIAGGVIPSRTPALLCDNKQPCEIFNFARLFP